MKIFESLIIILRILDFIFLTIGESHRSQTSHTVEWHEMEWIKRKISERIKKFFLVLERLRSYERFSAFLRKMSKFRGFLGIL